MLKFALALACLLFMDLVLISEAKQCYRKRCMNCPPGEVSSSAEVSECRVNDEVSVSWLGDVHVSVPDGVVVAVDFVCLKMYADPEPGTTNSQPDLLKGCVIAERANEVCTELVSAERARGRTARCFQCTRDLCNSAGNQRPLLAVLAFAVLPIIFLRSA